MDWLLTLSGFGVGFLVGMTGVGGGSLMTPILIFLFGISPAIAVGTDLLFAAMTKATGIWAHARRHTIDWRVVRLLALGSLPAALLTMYFLASLRAGGRDFDVLISSGLGIALILTSLSILFKRDMHRLSWRLREIFPGWVGWRTLITVGAGILLGILVPLTSVGAGALGAGMLLFLYPRMPTVRVVGTDLAHAVPLTAVAGLGHLHLGTVDLSLLGILLLGSLPGIFVGSHMATLVPERVMRPLLASVLLLIGVKFAFVN